MKIYKMVKAMCDRVLALICLALLWPVFFIISVAVKLETPGPVFFKQRRIGKNKKEFNIIKFRTMRFDTPKDTPTHLLDNAHAYITKTGKILRKTSLDELPQLINILKGEMSFIGPRPALWNQYDLMEEREKYGANDVKPGLTGWAQINGRDELPIPVKAELDGYYVKNMSLFLDVKIFFMTLAGVATSKGVREGSGSGESAEDEGKIAGNSASIIEPINEPIESSEINKKEQ